MDRIVATPSFPTFWESDDSRERLQQLLTFAKVRPVPPASVELRAATVTMLSGYGSRVHELTDRERAWLRNVILRRLMGVIRCWKRTMVAKYGEGSWQSARATLGSDSRTEAWLAMIDQVATGHNQDSLDVLEDLAKVGMTWTLASGRAKTERYVDFGLTYLHVVTTRVEHHLLRNTPKAAAQPTPMANGHRPELKPLVTMKIDDHGRLNLYYRMKVRGKRVPAILTGKSKVLLLVLSSRSYRDSRNAWDEALWNSIWNTSKKVPYRDACRKLKRQDGVHSRIRKLVDATNQKLNELVGKPPAGRWINRTVEEGQRGMRAYVLNDHVKWKLDDEQDDGTDVRHFDPSVVDQYQAKSERGRQSSDRDS